MIEFELDGRPVSVDVDDVSLLEALREHLGVTSAKDGCSPQGQCGCCTVWVDGAARVACVTPVRRVAGRSVTTLDGLPDADEWAEALMSTGGSQCGFCTPGIVMRLAALTDDQQRDESAVRSALLAHLCRCTGWNSIVEAAVERPTRRPGRDLAAAERRATLEGGVAQRVHLDVALGRGGFADDDAPRHALVAVRSPHGSWAVGDTVAEARAAAGLVPGRRTTAPPTWPVDVPPGDWVRTLRTTWVEPAYLEPDAAWCLPGGEPASPLGNGGAFGGKSTSEVGTVARHLADTHGRAVRVLATREDTVRFGPKRPPMGIGLRADGTGTVFVARPSNRADESVLIARMTAAAPVDVHFVDVAGPPVSASLRGAGWAEVAAVRAALGDLDRVSTPDGAMATAWWDADELHVEVECGDPLDDVVLRSYCLGAAHMALGWVRSEALVVDGHGAPHDLTIRSFGVLRAVDTPEVDVSIVPSNGQPTKGSDAVFAAVAAATWRRHGHPTTWPVPR